MSTNSTSTSPNSSRGPFYNIFSYATHAEDQENATAILTTHVAHRGFQTGAVIGLITGAVRARRASPSTTPTAITSPKIPSDPRSLILASTGRSALITAALLTVSVPVYMHWVLRDTPEPEDRDFAWRDRSYRLLHNEGQVAVDKGSVLGMGASAALIALRRGNVPMGVYPAVGRIGMASLVGVVGAEIWRAVR